MFLDALERSELRLSGQCLSIIICPVFTSQSKCEVFDHMYVYVDMYMYVQFIYLFRLSLLEGDYFAACKIV